MHAESARFVRLPSHSQYGSLRKHTLSTPLSSLPSPKNIHPKVPSSTVSLLTIRRTSIRSKPASPRRPTVHTHTTAEATLGSQPRSSRFLDIPPPARELVPVRISPAQHAESARGCPRRAGQDAERGVWGVRETILGRATGTCCGWPLHGICPM